MKDYLSDDAIQETWDSIAKSFHKTRKNSWQPCLDFISSLTNDAVVGDFGCGNGRHTIEIARSGKKVIGIDISNNLLQIIKQNTKIYHNITLIHGNLTSVPIKDYCLDAILFIASLHNIPRKNKRVQSLKEAFRVLKSGGRMLLSVWNLHHKEINKINDNVLSLDIEKNYLETGDVFIFWNRDSFNIPRFYHFYTEDEIIKEARTVGFHIDLFIPVKIASKKHPDNYFLYLTKKK